LYSIFLISRCPKKQSKFFHTIKNNSPNKQNPNTNNINKYSILICGFTIGLTNRATALLKKIEFDFVQPYDKVALYKGLKETSTAGAMLVLEDSGGESPAWYRLVFSVRTIFEHGAR
jgi:hypothetical protein